jgi:putative transposase
MQRAPSDPDAVKRWLTFLRNHREAIAAMDFFYRSDAHAWVRYCFFVIGHDRRKILHFKVMPNPNALWVVQQLREAWAYQPPDRFLLFDRDAQFGAEVDSAVRDMGSPPTRTAFRSPWQNGVAERWVGSCRRDLLDHVIILNERHLKRLIFLYLLYDHQDRTHLGLGKDTPAGRVAASVSPGGNKIISWPRLGGLHPRYAVAA